MNTLGFRWHYKCLSLSQQLFYLAVVCWPCLFTARDALLQLCWWSLCVPGNGERWIWILCSSSETERGSWRMSWRQRGRTGIGKWLLSQKRRGKMNKGLQRWETQTTPTACQLDSENKKSTFLKNKTLYCVLTKYKMTSCLSLYMYIWPIKLMFFYSIFTKNSQKVH